ncbi:hypothetical protein MRB53_039701 [Persea americana]|nr:hypothetical protein MRB53_039701 [Persea americana]
MHMGQSKGYETYTLSSSFLSLMSPGERVKPECLAGRSGALRTPLADSLPQAFASSFSCRRAISFHRSAETRLSYASMGALPSELRDLSECQGHVCPFSWAGGIVARWTVRCHTACRGMVVNPPTANIPCAAKVRQVSGARNDLRLSKIRSTMNIYRIAHRPKP